MTTPIHLKRAQILERHQALATVINTRTDLTELRTKLESLVANARHHSPELLDRHEARISEMEERLTLAEKFCQKVAPDLLADHDEQAAALEQARHEERQTLEAQYEADRLATLARSNEAAIARIASRRRVQAEAD